MARQLKVEAPAWPAEVPSKSEEWRIQLKVITPMFGGGYKSREVDPVNIIRPAAIRGHLRFWWRATAGGQFNSLEELFEAERALWGGTDKHGLITVKAEIVGNLPKLIRLDKANVPDYVRAILVQETPPTEKSLRQKARDEGWDHSRLRSELNNHESVIEKEKDELYPFVSREGFSVQLTLCFIRKDIDFAHLGRTLKAFVLFGGVGGRVRRGFGSLELIHQSGGFLKSGDFLSTMEMKQSWIDSIQSLPPGCASLKEARVYCGTNPHSNATDAWHEAARIYQHFRKAEIPNRRRPSRGTGSHSTWPEADTIRQLKRISIINQAYNGFRSFPRAQLGLPLVFRSIKGQHGHFGEAELLLSINGTETSRLASPVILKPIRKQEKYYAAIIILNQTRLGDGDIKVKGFDQFSVGADCTNTPVGLWDGRSDTPFQHSHQNILDVLEDYLKTHAKWNQEVIAQL